MYEEIYSMVRGAVLELSKVQGQTSVPSRQTASRRGSIMQMGIDHHGLHHEITKECERIGYYPSDC